VSVISKFCVLFLIIMPVLLAITCLFIPIDFLSTLIISSCSYIALGLCEYQFSGVSMS
jgi:hypothetical protein